MAQSNGAMLIRPENIDKLPFLDDAKKATYKNGLANLWRQYENNPVGSPERNGAEMRIRQASQKIMQDISKVNRPGSGAGIPQQTQNQPRPGTGGGQQSGMPQQQQHGNPGQQNQHAQIPQPATNQIPPSVRQTLDAVTIHVPSHLPPQQHSNYKSKWYQQAAQHLISRERLMTGGRQLQQRIQQARAANQEIPPTLQTQFENAKRQLTEIDNKWNAMRSGNDQNGRANAQALERVQTQQAQAQQAQAKAQAQALQQQREQNQQSNVQNAQQAAAQAQSQAQFQPQNGLTAQDVKQEQRVPNTPAQPTPSFQQNAAAQAATNSALPAQQQQQQQQPQPQSASAPHPPQGFPSVQLQQQQQQANQRPALGAQMPQPVAGQQIPLLNHAQAQIQVPPTSATAMPPNAVQAQRPQPLSQQAAMAQAAEHRGQTHAAANMGPGQLPQTNNMASNAPFAPSGGGGQSTPNSAYPPPHQMQATQQPPTNKFPIGKTVQLDPRTQNPVAGPPSRPTLANQGMIAQPGLTRPQPFTLEGEGDRVLSKRKLDELVRQVTGSSDASPESGGLSPEVEEAMLSLADDFVDNVITSACRLAKIRSGQTLDIKDVQMVLERNYGIRIPGYSLDEVRTVRKFQPAPGWQSKMQAIQTAKTLGGVGKSDS